MTMVAVTTLREEGNVEIAKEALADRGIPVEIKNLGGFALYFGASNVNEFEVRVPEERLDEARGVLEALNAELEQRVLAEAGIPPEEDDRGPSELPPPELRPRKVSWAIALGLVGPLPGCGLLYARAFRLGYLFFGLSIALFVGGVAAGNGDTLVMIAILKALDVVMAPFFAARFNKKLLQEESKGSYAATA